MPEFDDRPYQVTYALIIASGWLATAAILLTRGRVAGRRIAALAYLWFVVCGLLAFSVSLEMDAQAGTFLSISLTNIHLWLAGPPLLLTSLALLISGTCRQRLQVLTWYVAFFGLLYLGIDVRAAVLLALPSIVFPAAWLARQLL